MPDSDPTTIAPQPPSGWNGEWHPDPATLDRLRRIAPGSRLMSLKRRPDGTESTRYPGTLVETSAPSPWIEIEAIWDAPVVSAAGLMFEPGDILREFYSPIHPFNAFAVATADGMHKGWYGNVTYPALLLDDASPPTLVWHDLFLDVVSLADGTIHLLDDDELDAAPPPFSEPVMRRAIHAARDDLLAFIRSLGQH